MRSLAIRLFVAICYSASAVQIVWSSDDGKEEKLSNALSQYEQQLQFVRSCSFEFTCAFYEQGGRIGNEEKLVGYDRGSVAVSGSEFRLRSRQRGVTLIGTDYQARDVDAEDVFTQRRRFHLQTDFVVSEPFVNEIFPQAEIKNYFVVGYDKKPTTYEVHALRGFFGPLYGYLRYDAGHNLPSLLQLGEVSVSSSIDDHPTIRIVSRGDYGMHVVWLDPAFGYLPRKIEMRKQGNDLYHETPI